MRVTLMHNPGAGEEDHDAEGLRAALAGAGHDVRYASTADGLGALEEPADVVVIAGGDGTVSSIVTALAGRGVPVAVLPLGSANNIARSLSTGDAGAEALARALVGASRRPFDVGELRADGGTARFVESVGGGVFAEALVRAEEHRGDPDGEEKRRHGLQLLLATIAETPALHWELAADGDDLSGDYLAVEAMNIREIGPNLALAPEADPGDGLLDLVLIGPAHRDLLARTVEASSRGEPAPQPLPARRARRISVVVPAGCPVHLDDEVRPAPAAGGARGEVRLGDAVPVLVAP
jgi:diacylglycerol kinase (ATP)